jgi:hypothetical protein
LSAARNAKLELAVAGLIADMEFAWDVVRLGEMHTVEFVAHRVSL